MAIKSGTSAIPARGLLHSPFYGVLKDRRKRGVIILASCYHGLCPDITAAFKKGYNLWSSLPGIIVFSPNFSDTAQ